MLDIALCQNHDCKVKYNCYRYMTKPSEYQTYAEFCRDVDDCYQEMRGMRGNNVEKTQRDT